MRRGTRFIPSSLHAPTSASSRVRTKLRTQKPAAKSFYGAISKDGVASRIGRASHRRRVSVLGRRKAFWPATAAHWARLKVELALDLIQRRFDPSRLEFAEPFDENPAREDSQAAKSTGLEKRSQAIGEQSS
jgi:hypothetical protein